MWNVSELLAAIRASAAIPIAGAQTPTMAVGLVPHLSANGEASGGLKELSRGELVADQVDKLIGGRGTPCLFLGVDLFAIHKNR